MIMHFKESLMDLPRPNIFATPIQEVKKSNLSRVDICKFISNIAIILETVCCDLEELKEKSMEKFQEKYSFLEDYQELEQYVLKNCGNYNEKNELITIIYPH